METHLNGQRGECGPGDLDPDLTDLQRVLMKNGNAVFSPPANHPCASSEEIEHLMLVTRSKRLRHKFFGFLGPDRTSRPLALAASLLILAGGSLFVFFRQPPTHGIVVALLLPPTDMDPSFLFRGESVTREDFESTLESSIRRTLVDRQAVEDALFLRLDPRPAPWDSAAPMDLLPSKLRSKLVLVVTQDDVSGSVVFSLFDCATGAILGKRELPIDGNELLSQAVPTLVSELLEENPLR